MKKITFCVVLLMVFNFLSFAKKTSLLDLMQAGMYEEAEKRLDELTVMKKNEYKNSKKLITELETKDETTGQTAFSYSIINKQDKLFDKFVSITKKELLNIADNEGYTPLMRAIESNNYDYCKKLLNTDLSFINYKNESGITPLMLAQICYSEDSVNYDERILNEFISILDSSKVVLDNIDSISKNYYLTSMEIALIRNDKALIGALINSGANVNFKFTWLKDYFSEELTEPNERILESIFGTRNNEYIVNKNNLSDFLSFKNKFNTEFAGSKKVNCDLVYFLSRFSNSDFYKDEEDLKDIFQILLSHGATVSNNSDFEGYTAFHHIAKQNRTKVYDYFVENKADEFIDALDNETPFSLIGQNLESPQTQLSVFYTKEKNRTKTAIEERNFLREKERILNSIISNSINGVESKNGRTALIISVINNDKEATSKLINSGADPFKKDKQKLDAVNYMFEQYGFEDAITIVLKNESFNPINYVFDAIDAKLQGKMSDISSFIKCLNEENVPGKWITYNGRKLSATPQIYVLITDNDNHSIQKKDRTELFKDISLYLNQENTLVNQGEYKGWSPLFFAVNENITQVVDYLLDRNVETDNYDLLTKESLLFFALRKAYENADYSIIEKIVTKIGYHVPYNEIISSDNRVTLLMYFARYGNLKLIQDYVFHNKDYYANDLDSYKSFLNKIDKAGTGKNAFMYAATYNKDYKVLKFLRFEGADVFNKDSDGKDALMLACQNNNEITVIYRLLDYGFDYTQKDKENNNAAYYLTKNSSLNTDKELMKMIAPNKIQEER